MQIGHILLCFCFRLTFMERCDTGNHPKTIRGLQQNITHRYYRVVKGETFMMPCNAYREALCFRFQEEGNECFSFDGERESSAATKHSGNYTCLTCGSKFHLQVVEKTSLRCSELEDNTVMLPVGKGGNISCPGYNCYNTGVIWYKGNKALSEMKIDSFTKNGSLHLGTVFEHHTGVYFCDRQITEHGVTWTFRRAVKVVSIPWEKVTPPRIVRPDGNMTEEEVELGQSHTLTCEVHFPFEINLSMDVQWYMNYDGNMENMTHGVTQQQTSLTFHWVQVIQRAVIRKVTPLHLNHTYTCIAWNNVGNRNVTIILKEKIKVKWPSLVGYPIVSLLLVAGMGIVLHVKWLELRLIYRSHLQCGRLDGDEKEFDVFLSYVRSPSPAEVEGGVTLSSTSRPDTDVKACPSCLDPLNTEEGNTQRAPEVLLPHVLEDQWGYRLCLLERDVLPGGAYTNDVVLAIQRSKMLICLLSDDFLSNSNAAFILESGIQALLQNTSLKLLLIWTSRTSTSLIQPDPPLPSMVQKALKVLPSLDWTSGKPARATSNFWRSLKKTMPKK
ncbi:hypothetical protein PAMA_000635 [Pampus argenteus]